MKEGYAPAREFFYHVSQGDNNAINQFGLFIEWQIGAGDCRDSPSLQLG